MSGRFQLIETRRYVGETHDVKVYHAYDHSEDAEREAGQIDGACFRDAEGRVYRVRQTHIRETY